MITANQIQELGFIRDTNLKDLFADGDTTHIQKWDYKNICFLFNPNEGKGRIYNLPFKGGKSIAVGNIYGLQNLQYHLEKGTSIEDIYSNMHSYAHAISTPYSPLNERIVN